MARGDGTGPGGQGPGTGRGIGRGGPDQEGGFGAATGGYCVCRNAVKEQPIRWEAPAMRSMIRSAEWL